VSNDVLQIDVRARLRPVRLDRALRLARDSLSEACRRLAHSDVVSEELAERCREAFDGHDGDGTPDRTRSQADHATDPRERLDAAGIAPRTPAR